ncbi:oxygenase MpaB family protein [Actinoplanes couchii]|uniref:ER-bound oxygenase mpaB/mpaB'/Rubber oxygenase catalytic domain-containing protein n=1 Tax=Actinoplanes couchii TaxID=403638 RepID=A0ABQ3XU87_9ACTN|nr:oxygenase MpaB family protein [Actinoplanes couchii]MDR6319979.1 uncharacterized protein (DUF2236 family) [Actinoplanes couchii]GID62067.1 hypothetical protein Aco03nite_104710 [Actinoplanes couchii]
MTDDRTGLFTPESVSWKVFDDPIVALGGLRSLYLQALHPRAVAAIAQNSSYRIDPWRRLIATWGFLRTILYGTSTEAHAMAGRVRRLHASMRATDPRTGEHYRIDEPELLLWVHVTEVESFVTTVRRAGIRLSDDEVDGFYAEQRVCAELVGLDPAAVPGSAAEVAAYYDSVRPELGHTPEAAEVAGFLTTYPPAPAAVRNRAVRLALDSGSANRMYSGLTVTAIGLLPGWARRLYGFRDRPFNNLTTDLSVRATRLLIHTGLPDRHRVPPMRQAALHRAGR